MMMGKQVRENRQNSLPTSANRQLGPRPFASPEPEHDSLNREARFGHSFSEMDLFSRQSIKPKRIVSPPDDRYEHETDRVAEQVPKGPGHTLELYTFPERVGIENSIPTERQYQLGRRFRILVGHLLPAGIRINLEWQRPPVNHLEYLGFYRARLEQSGPRTRADPHWKTEL